MEINKAAQQLGRMTSVKKAKASRENGKLGGRPHMDKCKYFERIYPHKLESNEWIYKVEVGKTSTGRKATYNPDYYCPKTKTYIEVTTSKSNMVEQGWKWAEAIKRGLKLKVFWWEGKDITKKYKSLKENQEIGGYPKGRPNKKKEKNATN